MSPPATVPELLARTVERYADRPALVDATGRRTWAEVADAVEREAAALEARGIGPGGTVAMVMGTTGTFVTTFLAVLGTGAVAMPLNPRSSATELAGQLTRRPVAGVVADPDAAVLVKTALSGPAATRTGTWATTPDELAAQPPTSRSATTRARPDDPALHAFSSGSTGTPKGLLRTHANLVAEADQFAATCGTSEDDVVLTSIALFHAHGLGNCLLAALRAGASMVVADPLELDRLGEAVAAERVSVFPTVPPVVRLLAERRRGLPDTVDPGRLRLCFTAGAPLAPETFTAFLDRTGVAVRQLYGCSEAGSVTVNLDPDPVATAASVGTPLHGVRLRVVDEHGEPCAAGATGEVVFASRALTAGYLDGGGADDPFAGGEFRTGDLGHLDDAGRLHVTGRTKLFIATGGFKVDPAHVEHVLRGEPRVRDVVVVGARGPHDGEVVKAVVVADGVDGAADGSAERELRDALVARCRTELAVHEVPRVVEFRAEIPRSPLGKILRKDLV